ncbi:hypothetical protein REPUB_Repub17cG0145400 [Reevesia pubescens]
MTPKSDQLSICRIKVIFLTGNESCDPGPSKEALDASFMREMGFGRSLTRPILCEEVKGPGSNEAEDTCVEAHRLGLLRAVML